MVHQEATLSSTAAVVAPTAATITPAVATLFRHHLSPTLLVSPAPPLFPTPLVVTFLVQFHGSQLFLLMMSSLHWALRMVFLWLLLLSFTRLAPSGSGYILRLFWRLFSITNINCRRPSSHDLLSSLPFVSLELKLGI